GCPTAPRPKPSCCHREKEPDGNWRRHPESVASASLLPCLHQVRWVGSRWRGSQSEMQRQAERFLALKRWMVTPPLLHRKSAAVVARQPSKFSAISRSATSSCCHRMWRKRSGRLLAVATRANPESNEVQRMRG